ncbi:MAG: PEP-CTERM sorting domain-containing protein [Acetobacteraceae bacterium]
MGRIGDPFHPEIVPQAAPEPFSLALLGTGLFGIVAARRRR